MIFSPKGILVPNFEFRPQQQQMAIAAARALQNGDHLAVKPEPVSARAWRILSPRSCTPWQEKVVVCTHTINLQEQLTQKICPRSSRYRPFNFSMLKGRANYLCTRRLQKAMQQSGHLFTSSRLRIGPYL
jgi:Rad3-related DNA helicase